MTREATLRVWVVGAGYVGTALVEVLLAGGHEVVASRRAGKPVPAGATPHPIDLDGVVEAPADVREVVIAVAPDEASDASYARIYRAGTMAVLAALDRAGATPRRIVFVSSTSVFAEDDGGDVDEGSAVLSTPRAQALLDAESAVRARAGGIALRLAGIYGPGRDRLVRMVRDGVARIASSRPIGNRIHRDDCVGAIVHLLTHPAPASLYVGVDHAPVELAEVYRFLAHELGVPEPLESDEVDARGRGPRRVARGARLVASGYRFRFPTYREGYRSIIAARVED